MTIPEIKIYVLFRKELIDHKTYLDNWNDLNFKNHSYTDTGAYKDGIHKKLSKYIFKDENTIKSIWEQPIAEMKEKLANPNFVPRDSELNIANLDKIIPLNMKANNFFKQIKNLVNQKINGINQKEAEYKERLKQIFEMFDENRFKDIENSFKDIENRSKDIENSFKDIENRFKYIENRFKYIEDRFKDIEDSFKDIENSFKYIEDKFKYIEDKFKDIENSFKDIENRSKDIENRFKKQFDRFERRWKLYKQNPELVENLEKIAVNKEGIIYDFVEHELKYSGQEEVNEIVEKLNSLIQKTEDKLETLGYEGEIDIEWKEDFIKKLEEEIEGFKELLKEEEEEDDNVKEIDILKIIKTLIQNEKQKLQRVESEIAELKNQNNKLQQENKFYEEEAKRQELEIKKLGFAHESEKNQLQGKVQHLLNEQKEFLRKKEELDKQLTDQAQQIYQLTIQLNNKEITEQRLNERIKELTEENKKIPQLKAIEKENKATLEKLEEIVKLSKDKNLKDYVQVISLIIQNLHERILEQKASLEAEEKDKTRIKKELADLKTFAGSSEKEKDSKFAELNNKFNKLEAELQTKKLTEPLTISKIKDLEEQVKYYQQELKKTIKEFDSITTQYQQEKTAWNWKKYVLWGSIAVLGGGIIWFAWKKIIGLFGFN